MTYDQMILRAVESSTQSNHVDCRVALMSRGTQTEIYNGGICEELPLNNVVSSGELVSVCVVTLWCVLKQNLKNLKQNQKNICT